VIVNVPRRYLIGFTTLEGSDSEYSVVSWFGRDKAIAWAASVHHGRDPAKSIYQVHVTDLGEPELTASGYELEPDEFTDRMEW
jgi:hypothetical protein